MRTTHKNLLPLITLAASMMADRASATEPGFTVERGAPAEAGSAWSQADSLTFGDAKLRAVAPETVRESLVFRVGATYSADPLLVVNTSNDIVTKLLDAQVTSTLGTSFTVKSVRFGVMLPVQVFASGERSVDAAYAYGPPANAFALGDVRLGVHWKFVDSEALRAAVGGQMHLPTGDQASYAGDGTLRVEPQGMLAGRASWFAWAAQAGLPLRTAGADRFGDITVGHEVRGVVAAGYASENGKWLVGPEMRVALPLQTSVVDGRATTLVPMAGAHYTFAEGWRGHAAAGFGIGDGIGTPYWTANAALEWAPFAAKAAEPAPEPIVLPVVVEPAPPAPVEEPPPPVDVAPPPPPPDADADGIPDAEDACPSEAGKPSELPAFHGCADVVVTPVKFKVSSDVFQEASIPELEKLRANLARYPLSYRFRIEGHTDTSGDPKDNVILSQKRAAAVVRWLVAKGFDANRFDAQGMGSSVPLVDNDTPENRAHNRRVEVHVLAPTPVPAAPPAVSKPNSEAPAAPAETAPAPEQPAPAPNGTEGTP
jgi:outer membrane protein OmpA-like peptidoglycan-associated protein